MMKAACIFCLCISLASAGCTDCSSGHFEATVGWLSPGGGFSYVCGVVEAHPDQASGIFCPSTEKCKQSIWAPGKGNIIHDGDYCITVQDGAANVSATFGHAYQGPVTFMAAHTIAKVLKSGKLEGLHTQLDLGRPGRCAADAKVRILGEPLKEADGTPMVFKVGSVGECCDKCAETSGCAGWNDENGACSLLSALSGTWAENPGTFMFSGVNANAIVAV